MNFFINIYLQQLHSLRLLYKHIWNKLKDQDFSYHTFSGHSFTLTLTLSGDGDGKSGVPKVIWPGRRGDNSHIDRVLVYNKRLDEESKVKNECDIEGE